MTPHEERRLLTPEEYRQAQDSPEFTELRRRFRSFAVPIERFRDGILIDEAAAAAVAH